MIFYTLVFCIIFFLTYFEEQLEEEKRSYLDITMILILASLTAFRSIGGNDFEIYRYFYNKTPEFGNLLQNSSVLLKQIEKGYVFYLSFIKTYLNLSYYGYLVLQSALIYTLMYLGLKKYTAHWGLFIMLFMYKMFFYDTFVSMRQPLTIAAFFMIMHFIEEKKWLPYYLIVIFITIPLHNGAYFLLFLYPLAYLNLSKKLIIILNIIFIPTLILPQLGLNPMKTVIFFFDYIEDGYVRSKMNAWANAQERLSILYSFEYLLLMALLLLNYDKIISSHKYAPLIIKLFLVILPMVTLFRENISVRRELDYLFPTYAFLIGYICDIKVKKWYFILGSAIICFYGYWRMAALFGEGQYESWLNIEDATFFLNK
ncbi:MAG: EpsG family protein [Dysgonamonadaceae bacterium]|jgi:hypothetical protein|nr:EpsG family protein [Dysgonamonadaceae bacterium]